MRARGVLGLVALGIVLGASVALLADRLPSGSLGAALAAARRSSDEARASALRLRDGLGHLVLDLDGALDQAGQLVDAFARLRARERVYAGIAGELRSIASGLDDAVPTP